MKKTLFVLLAALLVLGAFSVALADDFNPVCATCGSLEKVNAYVACNGAGDLVYYCPTCAVGAGITPGSATIPHVWTNDTLKTAPTCVSNGVYTHECAVCGKKEDYEYGAPTGHRWGTYDPTKTYTIGVFNENGDGVTLLSEPSCTITGSYSLSCLNGCGLESGVKYGTISAVGHLYRCPTLTPSPRRMDTVVEQALIAYGDAVGPTTFAAATRGNSKDGLYIAANCVHEGYINVYCVVCDNLHKIVIPKTAHTWDPAHSQTTNSTCIKYGTSSRICTVCAQIVTERLPLAGHKWLGNSLTGNEWFWLSSTLKYKKCSVCGRIETYRITASSDELIGVTNGTKAENIGTLTAGNPTITQPNNGNPVAKKASTSAAKASASSTKANASGVSIPKTNDNTSTLPFVMMGIALVGIVALIASKRKVNG